MINHKKEKFGNIVESGLTEGQRSDFQNTKVSFSPNYNKKSSAYINNKGESCENLE
ncbi:MAG: hypothetical protein KDH96_06515 [Candidatus Riesia sp.]|nr:hypothetical protein [Candidatus Riesia sp.]